MNRFSFASTCLAVSALVGWPLGTAQARIICDGNFQIIQGQYVATPYCREDNLARVAQAYGLRVSSREIRYSESVKGDVCRTIGHDNRVSETCQPYRNDAGTILRE